MTSSARSAQTVFRYFFLYIEPISALAGAYAAALRPQFYLEMTHAATAPKFGIPTSTSIVLTQLANLYLLFAVNEAVVLRCTDDVKVWSALLSGLLLADLGHLYSVNALGSRIYWNVAAWNAMDWGNVGIVYVGAAMRIAFLSIAWASRQSSRPQRHSERIRKTPTKLKARQPDL